MKKIYTLGIISLFIVIMIPNLVFAVWWNPFTWFSLQTIEKPRVSNSLSAISNPKSETEQKNNVASSTPTRKAVISKKRVQAVNNQKPDQKLKSNVIYSENQATTSNSITGTTTPATKNLGAEQICQKIYEINYVDFWNILLAPHCTRFSSGDVTLTDVIKKIWEDNQQLINWDKSSLVTFISNPTSDSFKTLCNSVDKIKLPWLKEEVLSSDRTSKVWMPHTLFEIMRCEIINDQKYAFMTVTPGLLQSDFNNDSDSLRIQKINYNDKLKEFLENVSGIIVINSDIVPFIDQQTKHLGTVRGQHFLLEIYSPVQRADGLIKGRMNSGIYDISLRIPCNYVGGILQGLNGNYVGLDDC